MRYTAENARLYSMMGVEARRRNLAARKLEREQAKLAPKVTEVSYLDPTYDERRLSRVRAQLDRVDDMILHEDDPQRLDRLAAASARLSEQVRILSNKPLPGSYKPTGKPTKRQAPGDISPDLQS